ncbi:ATP-binding protein [Gymnodinialimonas sp. 2305UL16-5]|uniref:PAS domain-containing sensor histidine kinase n=1 Tax=Gymnodinialimonas mytili TaxID=3126503 RepID=UPI0030A7CCF5
MSYMVADPQDQALSRLMVWINDIDLPMFVLRRTDDTRLEYVHANGALGRIAGFDSSIMAGETPSNLFNARTAAKLEANYWECLNSDDPVSYEECVIIDGRETWWETTLSKPFGFEGQIVLGLAVSITDRKQKEFANAEMIADLNARLDEIKLFSTMAAHDARSPLATVSALIDLVLDGFSDMGDGKAELLSLCAKTVDEALEQISATLERGRQFKQASTQGDRVDLGRLCADIAAMVDPEMQMDIEIPQQIVECDKVVVQMCIRNLVSNAARYCKSAISIQVTPSARPGMIVMEVSDDGPGVPPGTTVHDLSQAAESRGDGHGFGLKSISNLLSSHGGSIEIMHDPSEGGLHGARFCMTLPGRIIG